MPAETRRIIFTKNELIEAIYEHNQIAKKKLPPGMIVSCEAVSEAQVAVRLELVDQKSGEAETAEISPEVICAALLRYCIRNRIPVPKSAAKSIQVSGENIALTIRMRGKASQAVLTNADGSEVKMGQPDADSGGQEVTAPKGEVAAPS